VSRCAEKRKLSIQLSREKALRQELETAYSELVKLKRINDTFGHFVSPQVVRYLAEHPDLYHDRASERVTATVMFVDVRQFTSYAVSVAPEVAIRLAPTLTVDALTDMVLSTGVELVAVDKVGGPGILVPMCFAVCVPQA